MRLCSTAPASSSRGDTSSLAGALGGSRPRRSSVPVVCSGWARRNVRARRMPDVKPVREPDAGNPHVRFDERGRETKPTARIEAPVRRESRRQQLLPAPTATAPVLDSTCAVKGVVTLQVEVLSRELVVHPGSYGRAGTGDRTREAFRKDARLGRAAIRRAGTQVNSENPRKTVAGADPLRTWGRPRCSRPETIRWARAVRRGKGSRHAGRGGGATREARRAGEWPRRPVVADRGASGVGGARSTGEGRETGWREGALVLGASKRAEGQGDCRRG
jgi:hypothetical protein